MNCDMELTVIKLVYCGFVAKNNNKVVYCSQYPSYSGTVKPNFEITSSEFELKADDHVGKDTFINFILSHDIYQANGTWKGGQWSKDNFTLTNTTWFSGLWIGDKIKVNIIKEGIIKYKNSPFTEQDIILPDTEIYALSCNSVWKDKIYPFYMTDNPMPQYASDTLFVWANPTHILLKMLKRNSSPKIDFPNKIIPAGGEHLQPENTSGQREQALITINEEIGIPKEIINKCYFLELGIFDSSGRDPRYYIFSAIQDEEIIEFGIMRYSCTKANILLLQTSDEIELLETNPEDTIEIKSKSWENIYTLLDKYPDKYWMLKDHQKFIPFTIKKVTDFLSLPEHEQELFKF